MIAEKFVKKIFPKAKVYLRKKCGFDLFVIKIPHSKYNLSYVQRTPILAWRSAKKLIKFRKLGRE